MNFQFESSDTVSPQYFNISNAWMASSSTTDEGVPRA